MHDMLDSQLISLLMNDASRTSEELATQLNASSSTIRRRKEGLINQGTIRIVGIPEPTKIGMNIIAIIAFNVSHDHLNSVMDILKSRKDVKCLYATSGRYDLIAHMWFPSTEELYKFMEEAVAKIEGIRNTETFICMRVVKSFWSTDK